MPGVNSERSDTSPRGSGPVDGLEAVTAAFRDLHAASRSGVPSATERRRALEALRDCVAASRHEFAAAIASDFGCRSAEETVMSDVLPALAGLHHAIRHVAAWMRPRRRPTAIHFWPGSSRVEVQPKGVVLIVAPWNYPVNLCVGPLTAAIAAGNRVVVKPSELAPATAALLKRRLEPALGRQWVHVATGGPDVAAALAALPFDHILFTGSERVGKVVMRAAADNLTPVTLELGGKSPAIVHASYDLATAARRIARGKLMNAGQTCIAPDYALVPEGLVADFVRHYRAAVGALYPSVLANPSYTAIIDDRHYERLLGLATDARDKGARFDVIDPAGEAAPGALGDRGLRKVLPLVLTGLSADMRVMNEEIFGPLLPVVPYAGLEAAIGYVGARPRPLALYYFDTSRRRIAEVLERTVSGGVTINDTILHIAQEELPFGGIGASGMGAYHGEDGFLTFSHPKGVFRQARRPASELLAPPYGRAFSLLVDGMVRRYSGVRRWLRL